MKNGVYLILIFLVLACSETANQMEEKKSSEALAADDKNDVLTEIGDLINFVDPLENDTVWPMFEYYSGYFMDFTAYQGNYNIDTLQDNLHQYKAFKFKLISEDEACVLRFISCSDYGYASAWENGQFFGIIDSIIDPESNRFAARINEHRGANEFELAPHEVDFKKHEITIYTGDLADHYRLITE